MSFLITGVDPEGCVPGKAIAEQIWSRICIVKNAEFKPFQTVNLHPSS
jgi:hypothetical protein